MDFLKTLMLYMTMTFAASVQGAPTPAVTPEPTPAPTEVVATMLPDQQTSQDAAVTPAPAATKAPDAPARPTISPNPAYKNLRKGDRGDNVKKLQERLIELGYLTGKADGAYGNQTRKAVLLFQYHNGLTRDGVAGKATQTVLFEDPNVVFNPEFVTPTPVPGPTATVTPAPEATIAPPPEETPVPAPAALENVAVMLDGEALVCLRQEDGVTTSAPPRVYQDADGFVYILLNDLCAAVPDWSLSTDDLGDVIFSYRGQEAMISEENGVYTATAGDKELELEDGEIRLLQGKLLVRVTFVEKTVHATALYDEDNSTLTFALLK
ncbi:MAG: peptidoglycan-binding protein [Clostridia bacterium]|nr:peptidoglycan-binding protein [Clostridia bacterium]